MDNLYEIPLPPHEETLDLEIRSDGQQPRGVRIKEELMDPEPTVDPFPTAPEDVDLTGPINVIHEQLQKFLEVQKVKEWWKEQAMKLKKEGNLKDRKLEEKDQEMNNKALEFRKMMEKLKASQEEQKMLFQQLQQEKLKVEKGNDEIGRLEKEAKKMNEEKADLEGRIDRLVRVNGELERKLAVAQQLTENITIGNRQLMVENNGLKQKLSKAYSNHAIVSQDRDNWKGCFSQNVAYMQSMCNSGTRLIEQAGNPGQQQIEFQAERDAYLRAIEAPPAQQQEPIVELPDDTRTPKRQRLQQPNSTPSNLQLQMFQNSLQAAFPSGIFPNAQIPLNNRQFNPQLNGVPQMQPQQFRGGPMNFPGPSSQHLNGQGPNSK